MNRSHIIEALRAADWSNTPNGNLALIQAAIEHLEAQPSSVMGRVPDAVVEPKSRYIHRNGVEYEVVMIANGESTNPTYPPTIVYRGVANGKVWARPACDWDRSMQLVERPAPAKVEDTEQVSSAWLAQLRSEYRQLAEVAEKRQAKLQSALARVAELEGKLTDWVHEGFRLNEALAMARDAASKGDDARHAAGGMEMEIQELREKVAELQKELRSRWTYASTQATNCAGCGEHKHTPLRVDWMGGYVCLTCIDKKLEELHEKVTKLKKDLRSRWTYTGHNWVVCRYVYDANGKRVAGGYDPAQPSGPDWED
ncbi:TPA: hypothetical protein NID01_000530 [Pseudomonas aeruginosa]|nr:hypothetical protein [Pseudomonas aeruginosa]